jgi:hypothetical protein
MSQPVQWEQVWTYSNDHYQHVDIHEQGATYQFMHRKISTLTFGTNYEGKSISKLQIVIEKK